MTKWTLWEEDVAFDNSFESGSFNSKIGYRTVYSGIDMELGFALSTERLN
jgi:hypothetical protein